ncbi:MAG: ATP-binding protein [Thermoplasmata archaeon]
MNKEKIFVDREENLDELKHYMEEVKHQNSKFVLLEGEAGVGKTLLAEKFMDKCRENDFQIFRGKCLYHESSDPFLPFYDLFEGYIDDDNSGNGAITSQKSTRSLGLMGVQDDNVKENNTSISDKREMFFNKITNLVHRLADERPLLIFLDDLHSIDESSSFLLHHLVRNTQNSKVLFIGAYRPEELKVSEVELPFEIAIRRMNEEKLVKTVEVNRLEFNHISRIIKYYLNIEDLSASFIWTMYRESEGNPYFVFEILNSLMDEGVIDKNSFSQDIDEKLEDIKIPSTIKNITNRRINSLNKEQKKVLMFASIIGNEFDFELLENVTKIEVIDLLDIIDELIDKGIIKEKENMSDEIYKFNHVQTRTAVYDDMGKSRKRIMHAKVAEGIEEVYSERLEEYYYDLSRHCEKGKQYEKALDYSLKAGEQSINAFAVATAIDYYERALESLDKINDMENKEKTRFTKNSRRTQF